METKNLTVGEKIRIARKGRQLTQKELGELCGIAEQTIGQYERGTLNPKMETLGKIADALDIPFLTFISNDVESFKVNKGLVITVMKDLSEGEEETNFLNQIRALLQRLNRSGKKKAMERIEELTEIPRYQAKPATGSTNPTPEGKDTPEE